MRAVVEGRRSKEEALRRYHAFSAEHHWKFEAMKRVQDLVPRVPPRALVGVLQGFGRRRVTDWFFDHYLRIAPPEFVGQAPALDRRVPVAA